MRRFASLVTSLALAAGALLSLPVAVQAKAAYEYPGNVYYLAVGDGEGSGTWDGASCSNPTYYTNDVLETDDGGEDDLTDAVAHAVDLATDDSLSGLGNTLFLCAGTYTLTGDVEISDDLWVAGAGATKTIITSNELDHRAFLIDTDGQIDVSITAMAFSGFHSSDRGGVIKAYKTNLTIDAVTMSNNWSGTRGGAIALDGELGSALEISNSKFVNNNTSNECGGALFLTNGQSAVITRSTFSGNEANTEGGAICQEDDALTIDQSTFSKNVADGDGGAVYAANINLTVNRSTFFQNSAANGGAFNIDSQDGISEFYKNTFTKNAADGDGDGGAINKVGAGNMNVSYSSFAGHSAEYGAAICWCGAGELYSWNNTYSSNRVASQGGAIWAYNYFESTNDRFTSNVAEAAIGGGEGQGAAVLVDGDANIARAVFQGNSGGSTLEVWNSLDLIRSSFKENKNLRPRGSMIWTDYFSVLSVRENTFSGNIAPNGALFGACQSVDRTFAANNVIGKNSALWISLPVTQIIQNEWCDAPV